MSSLVLLLIVGVVGWILYKAQAQDGPSSSAPRYSDDQVQRCDAWLKACADTVQLPRMICGPVPDCFGHDEDVFAVFPVTLMESRAVRYSRSNYGGPTIRIMKGFSYRFGSSVGQSESVEEMRTLDSGTLVVTTKRLAFVGSIRTNSTDLNDVISVEDYSDGIRVHREHKQKAETYVLDFHTHPRGWWREWPAGRRLPDGEGHRLRQDFPSSHAAAVGAAKTRECGHAATTDNAGRAEPDVGEMSTTDRPENLALGAKQDDAPAAFDPAGELRRAVLLAGAAGWHQKSLLLWVGA